MIDKYLNKKVEIIEKMYQLSSTATKNTPLIQPAYQNKTVGILTGVSVPLRQIELDNSILISLDHVYCIKLVKED